MKRIHQDIVRLENEHFYLQMLIKAVEKKLYNHKEREKEIILELQALKDILKQKEE